MGSVSEIPNVDIAPFIAAETQQERHAAAKDQRMDPDAWKTCQYDRPEGLETSSPRNDRQSIG